MPDKKPEPFTAPPSLPGFEQEAHPTRRVKTLHKKQSKQLKKARKS